MGRCIPFRLPAADSAGSKSAACRQLRDAERAAVSTLLLACCGDVERSTAAMFLQCCRQQSVGSGAHDVDFVFCGQRQLVVQAPSALVLPVLCSVVSEVQRGVQDLLRLQSSLSTRLPFRWWWGGTLDVLAANTFAMSQET
jgi:hypothetical protein